MATKASKPPRRRFAAYRGEFPVSATFFEPLPEAELAAFEGEGYDADPLRRAEPAHSHATIGRYQHRIDRQGEIAMPKLTLYHAAPSRSSIVHWMLEELGEPYDIQLVSFKKGENRQPAFLAINPMGKLPALKHGDVVITEAAAICTYLADEFPKAKLNIPIGDPRRGIYLKWLFFGPSCVEPAITERAYPRKEPPSRATLGFGDFETVVDVLAKGVGAASPYLMGAQFTAADVIIGSGLRWGMMFKLLPERPEFAAYVTRLNERPALKRATEKDAKLAQQQEASA